MTADAKQIAEALCAPFEITEVKWKPQSVKGNRAMALCYIDARVIQDRLDDVMGVDNWMDEYEILHDGSVMCRLRIRIGGEWVTKADVGSPSEQPDQGDRLKAAFSDALKRAAVKFGIGRYIYRLTAQWVDYDPQRRQFSKTPLLPAWAIPKKVKENYAPYREPEAEQPPTSPPPPAQQPAAAEKPKQPLPQTTKELYARMTAAAPPKDGAALFEWVLRLEEHLTRLLPAYQCGNLSADLLEFAKLKTTEELKKLAAGNPTRGAWDKAVHFVSMCNPTARTR